MKAAGLKRFLCTFFGVGLGLILLVGLVNFVVDPYGCFGTNRAGVFLGSERDYKPVQIKRYPHDGVLLGNSLMGCIDPDDMRGKIRFFNASMAGARAEEIRCFAARYLDGEKLAVLGLDFGMMRMDGPMDFNDPLPHDLFYLLANRVFSLRVGEMSVTTLKRSWKGDEPGYKANGAGWNDTRKRLALDRSMAKPDYQAYPELIKRYFDKFQFDPRRAGEIRRLKQILDEKKIACVAFINPMHRMSWDLLKSSPSYPKYLEWKEEMRRIFPNLVEFGPEEFSAPEDYYKFDPGHYKPDTGAAIIETVLQKSGY